jgi:hypothetical protein
VRLVVTSPEYHIRPYILFYEVYERLECQRWDVTFIIAPLLSSSISLIRVSIFVMTAEEIAARVVRGLLVLGVNVCICKMHSPDGFSRLFRRFDIIADLLIN